MIFSSAEIAANYRNYGHLNSKMGEKSEFEELLGFLSDSGRLDIQMLALDQVKGLTGSSEGLETIKPHLDPLAKILCSLLTGKSELLSKAGFILVFHLTI